MESRPLRIGIIGCGNVLGAYLAEVGKLRLRGLAELTAACGRESQRAALEPSPPRKFTTVAEEIIEDPEIDLAVILTPPARHAPLAKAALQAGKHVLMEKPLGVNLEEAADLVAVAGKSRGHLLCAPFTLLSPTYQAIGRRIRNGDIGSPFLARARYGWSGPWWSDWFYREGGGCLFDLGVYNIASLTGWLGPARRVSAMTGVAIPERSINGRKVKVEAADNAQVLIDFGSACFAVVTAGFTMQQYRSPAVEVYGSEGTIQMLGDDWDPDGYEFWQNSLGAWQLFRETQPDWPWADGLRHLVECVRDGARPLISPQHAYHVLEIILKAQEAGKTGKAIAIESSFERPDFTAASREGDEAAHRIHDRTRK